MFHCPYCDAALEYVGYTETYGVDVDSYGGMDCLGGGEQWGSKYFCPECEHELTVGTSENDDLFIE